MDQLLKALANPVRRRVVEILLQNGPTPQEVVRQRLEALEGTMSKQMKELVAVGVVERDAPRGLCRIAHYDETLGALQAIADLDHTIAANRAELARELAEGLAELREAS